MQVGAFEFHDPVPQLDHPHMLVTLRPWIDVGSVGTLVLNTLEGLWGAKELGRLRRPGVFYDFTRYRPMLYRTESGERRVEVPSTVLRYAQGTGTHDFVFMHTLEPHSHGDDFVDSVVEVAAHLDVSRYCQVGAMYGSGPHTRPLLVTGSSSDEGVATQVRQLGVRSSSYQGPTSIMGMATQRMQERGITSVSMLVQLPPYARLDEDHRGQETLLRLLDSLYGFGLDVEAIGREGDAQYEELGRMMQGDSRAQAVVHQLELAYDAEVAAGPGPQEPTSRLSLEMERFLRNLERGDGGTPPTPPS